MKSNLKIISMLAAIGLYAIGSQAAVTFSDNFDEYSTGTFTNQTQVWQAHSGANPINIVGDPTGHPGNALQVSQSLAQDIHANIDTNNLFADVTLTNITFTTNIVVGVSTNITSVTNFSYAYSPSNSVNALYASLTVYVTSVPTVTSSSQTYFTHFYTTAGGFDDRIFITTNGVVTPGNYRLAVQNVGTSSTNAIPMDLTPNTAYTLVTRYVLRTGTAKIWVTPVGTPISETSAVSATGTDAAGTGNILAYAFRQNTGEGVVDVDNVVVGTAFADVLPGSVNPPSIIVQPQDTNVFAGTTVSFSALAVGDSPLSYQWYSATNGVTNGITGATGTTLILNSTTTNQTGLIFCVVSNLAGPITTRLAQLTVSPTPISPIIDTNITPSSITAIIGDTVTFTVAAHALPAPAYQWKFVPATNNQVTNIVAGSFATGTNTSTLTLTGVTTNQAGSYFVTITNNAPVGYTATNSALGVLTVVPPPVVSIAALRGMVDGTFAPTNTTAIYTIQGIVTTWTNMTTSATSSEFYIQDASGGIAVFWSGAAASTNVPPAGALVKVTGPLSAFSGLLEIEPVFSNPLHDVSIVSTNNPLPTPQPLIFDPAVGGSLATMKQFESSYFVASNVMLNLVTPTFVSGANDTITNNVRHVLQAANSVATVKFTNDVGQTFILFINGGTDIPGQLKATGPVTIYGVLGYFTAAGFEFTPSRFADIISYQHATNVLVNARKGDLPTNTYNDSVVRTGESLTTFVSIGDAAGGIVSLTPTGTLPTGAAWTGITSGLTATATFNYTGSPADAGNNFPIQLNVSTTAGTAYVESFNVYVPTLQEQGLAITEFLANPTTNTAAKFFNPLKRSTAVNNISTNDQYIEIVNQSGSDFGNEFFLDTGSFSKPVFDSFDGFGATLLSSNALVVYGGNGTNNLTPGLSVPVAISRGLFLPTTGTGVLELRNSFGYLVDRVTYSASDLSTNGSLSRFPTWTSAFAPQTYISTNLVTPGLQYDGSPWTSSAKLPAGVANVSIGYSNGKAVLTFPTAISQAYTLWGANVVNGPYSILFGQPFTVGSGSITNGNSASLQFYYISTQ